MPPSLRTLATQAGPLASILTLVTGICAVQVRAMNTPGKPATQVETKVENKGENKGDSKGGSAFAAGGITLAEAARIPQVAKLQARAGLTIPTPPFSLAGLAEARKMRPDVLKAWQDCLAQPLEPAEKEKWLKTLANPQPDQLPSRRYILYHGLGMGSQRRLLNAYYSGTDKLGTEDVFALTPWIVLGLRNAISATLVDVLKPTTWYRIGFMLEASPASIYDTHVADGLIPMEKAPYDQKAFRERFRHYNPLTREQYPTFLAYVQKHMDDNQIEDDGFARAALELELRPRFMAENHVGRAFGAYRTLLPPRDLVFNPMQPEGGYNEVAVFSRTEDPRTAVRILAVVLTDAGQYSVGYGVDNQGLEFFVEQARALAKALNLPLYDLRPKKP